MTSRFEHIATPLAGLFLIQRKPLGDERGYLERLYCAEELHALAPGKNIVQINHTLTVKRGTVRGLHFQRFPHMEAKMVTCLRGEVWDVAVDVRAHSPTFLHWHAEILSADNHKSLAIPEGFAHGFQTLTTDCEMLYFHTAPFHPEAECALHALDPRLAIAWPEPVTELSSRDADHPMLTPEFEP